jgi:predicted ArsR family transcriptional regulator
VTVEDRGVTADHADKLDRIREVAMTVSEPRNAGEIADAAGVSRNTAEKYLQQLVAARTLAVVERGRETCYRPDPVTQYLDQMRGLIEEHSKAELASELAAMRDEIAAWQDEYGVDSPDELRASVGDADLPAWERERRVQNAEDWEYYRERIDVVQRALELYDPVESARTTQRLAP